VVRAVTYERDSHRCVSCGALSPLQYQHRRAEGMGGRKAAPTLVEGLASCPLCNPRYEDTQQAVALAHGWKVRSWVRDMGAVPVFYAWEGRWCVLVGGERRPVSRAVAMEMMRDVYGDAWDDEKGLVA
jgi:hypothetical protein